MYGRSRIFAAALLLAAACSQPRDDKLATGTVKWFNDAKGFGFITPDSGGGDLFVHFSALRMPGSQTLHEGQRVRFVVIQGEKGPVAEEVRPEREGPE